MSVADGMRKMMALGIPMEEALAIVEAFEIPVTDARKERNRRYYEAHKPVLKRLNSDGEAKLDERLKSSENRLNSDASPRVRVEDKSLLQEIEPQQVSKKESKSREASVQDVLTAILDPLHAKAVIDHRKGFRGKFTPHAAALLAKKFARCPDPNAAADAMISNNWQGFEPEWLENRAQPRGSPARTPSGLNALTEQFKQELENDGYGRKGEEGGDPVADARFPLLTGPDH